MIIFRAIKYIAGATVNENSPKPDGSGSFTKADFVLYGSIHHQMRNDMNVLEKLRGVKDKETGLWEKGLYRGYYGTHFKID